MDGFHERNRNNVSCPGTAGSQTTRYPPVDVETRKSCWSQKRSSKFILKERDAIKIGAVGCGAVGLNTLKAFQIKGHEVLGYDVADNAKANIVAVLGHKFLALDFAELADCDIVCECVPTDPVDGSGRCDLTILEDVVDQFVLLENMPNYRCKVFVQRSTCLPGTARKYSKRLRKTAYVVNPSFIRKKTQLEDSINPESIAIAGSELAVEILLQVYQSFNAPIFISDNYEVVELLKYIENLTDAVLISLWNEFLTISDALEIPRSDFVKLVDAFVEREKFRTAVRVPGQAFAMSCLPKDLAAIVHRFSEYKISTLKGSLNTNNNIKKLYGENSYTGSELFVIKDGKLK